MVIHPSAETLRAFLDDRVDEAERESIVAHVDSCQDCQKTLEECLVSLRLTGPVVPAPAPQGSSISATHALPRPDPSLAETVALDAVGTGGRPAQAAHMPMVPGYELEAELGRGGMGVVYRARQVKANRTVALKTLRAGAGATSKEVERFHTEAKAAARLRHEHIVAVYDVDEAGGCHYFSMEFVAGRSLDKVLKDAPLDGRRAAKLLRDVADAVAYAHGQNVLHRDLKPANVMLDDKDAPRVTDFGLAKLVDDSSETQTGLIMGTPSYMSPEQSRGEQVDVRADVYSLGATLYSLLTGRPPFAGPTTVDTIRLLRESEPVAPHTMNPAIPPDLETICLKCLNKPPEKRYATARELVEELDRFLDGAPILARPVGRAERLRRWCRRKPWQALVAGLGVLLMLSLTVLGIGGLIVAGIQADLRRQAEERTTEADRMRHLAEVRLTNIQHVVAKRELAAHQFDEADRAIREVPKAVASFDTWWLGRQAGAAPRIEHTLSEDFWSLLDAAWHRPSRRLATTDAGGVTAVWDLTTKRLLKRLTEPRWNDPPQPVAPRHRHHFERRDDDDPRSWEECCVAVRWTDDGRFVLGASLTGRLLRFDAESGAKDVLCDVGEPLYAMAAAADGRVLLGGRRGGLFFRAADGSQIATRADQASPVVALVRDERPARWFVGREDGTIEVLDDKLQPRGQTQATAPVWSLAVSSSFITDQTTLAVGCGSRNLISYKVADDGTLAAREPLWLPERQDQRATAVQLVRFSSDGTRLFAGDDFGRLTCWERGVAEPLFTFQAKIQGFDPRRDWLTADLAKLDPPRALPGLFQRRFLVLIDTGVPGELLTAVEDAVFRLWRVEPSDSGVVQAESVGPKPRLAFDPADNHRLWALDEKGVLRVVDARSGKLIAQRDAHSGGQPDLTPVGRDGLMATVGGDAEVRFFRCDGKKIVPARNKLPHDRPLLSVAVSPGSRWVAAVDKTARLIVWDFASGRVEFLTKLSPNGERPSTGRVAFNCDGTRLAAFGSGQDAPIFGTDPFRPLNEYLSLAASGGQALAWSRREPRRVFATDDFPRIFYRTLGVKTEDALLRTGAIFPERIVRAILPTPDGRRWAWLEQGGRFVSVDHDTHQLLHTFPNPRRLDYDLAFDASTGVAALVDGDGTLEFWHSERLPQPLDAERDESNRWEATKLVHSSPASPFLFHVSMDDRNRVCALMQDGERESPVYFLREEATHVLRERLEVELPPADNYVNRGTLGLTFQPNGEPIVHVRRQRRDIGPFVGSQHVGTRAGPDDWRFETIVPSANMGFWPALIQDSRGDVNEVFHFNYGPYCLVRTFRNENEWKTEAVGVQGDAGPSLMVTDESGVQHFVIRPGRFQGHHKPRQYGRWDHGRWHTETIRTDGDADDLFIGLLAGGEPVVLWTEPRRSGVRDSRVLLRRTAEGWKPHLRLPENLALGVCCLAPDGTFHVLAAQGGETGISFALWTHKADHWTASTIWHGNVGTAMNGVVLLDESNHPVVVIGNSASFGSWEVLRRRH